MKNYSELGTLLTREEAKKIRGGHYGCMYDNECPAGSMCYNNVCVGDGGGTACPTNIGDCYGQPCTFIRSDGKEFPGKCNTDPLIPGFCGCIV